MDGKDSKNIARILIILAVVLCGICLILPWSGFSMNMMGFNVGADFYPWGSHTYADFGSMGSSLEGTSTFTSTDIWSIFYSINVGATEAGSETLTISTVAFMLFNLSFILCIITLIIGLISIKKIKTGNKILPLIAGLISLVTIISFVAAISVMIPEDPTGQMTGMLDYSFGFFMVITAMILFFVSFAILKSIKETAVGQTFPTPEVQVPPQQ